MDTRIRQDVRNFVRSAAILLSPSSRTSELTADECALIKQYVTTMSQAKHPWSEDTSRKDTSPKDLSPNETHIAVTV
jgi:hypothetical protein